DYIEKDYSRFHMPGHKGKSLPVFGDIIKYDLTEVTGTDSLFEASECILECEEEFSRLYETKRTLLSAGGSTLCIQTMLALVAKDGGKIIASRNIHTSAVGAMSLLNLEPIWVYPADNQTGLGLYSAVTPKQIQDAILENPDALAVYITSPNYFGIMADIKEISKVCKKHGIPLLVDNAHGATLKFYEDDLHPITLGADICCDSLHKTLPVLTGGALLHINNEKFIADAKRAMSLFGTTSPSYLIMLSCDLCIDYLKTCAKSDFKANILTTQRLKKIAQEKGFSIPTGITDNGRLTLILNGTGYTKETFLNHLHKNHIEPEFISDSGCVFLVSPYSSEKDIKRLEMAILSAEIKKQSETIFSIKHPEKALSPRKAMFSEKEIIKTQNALGRTACQVICPCPPGIPIIISGEKITADIQKLLVMYGIKELTVVK
ncbi:MAG: aminotransferase class I/II-fold pyridoxal phosphate-dependent enzyme, partial [Oscillospiraceae bacterium]